MLSFVSYMFELLIEFLLWLVPSSDGLRAREMKAVSRGSNILPRSDEDTCGEI